MMPCAKKSAYKSGKHCDFELLALRQTSESGTIDVYAHSQHNHQLKRRRRRPRRHPASSANTNANKQQINAFLQGKMKVPTNFLSAAIL
jgi:hypothetical protein